MIASRVELFVGSNSSSSSGGAPHFTYICECLFDTNMQSGHQMQETKTLHLNADAKRATHLQLVLHRCRENDHNICYQVGLASVRLHEHERMHKRLASSVEAFPKPMDPEFEAMLWPQMVRKQRAVAAEAFDEAKDALANIRALRAAGSELAEMERRQHALAAVDRFDEARRLQQDAAALRRDFGVPIASLRPVDGLAKAAAVRYFHLNRRPAAAGFWAESAADHARPLQEMVRAPLGGTVSKEELAAIGYRARVNEMAAHLRLPRLPYSEIA